MSLKVMQRFLQRCDDLIVSTLWTEAAIVELGMVVGAEPNQVVRMIVLARRDGRDMC